MLLQALNLLSLGYSIIPVSPKGKTPLVKWEEFQHRRASEDEVRNWLRQWPNLNIGVVTGAISNCVVVDADGVEGIRSLDNLQLTSSLSSLTGNGKHLWYKHPGLAITNSVRAYAGVDIRGDGGYIVAPPSVHENGKRYRFLGRGVVAAGLLPVFPSQTFVGTASQTTTDQNDVGWISTALKEMTNGNIDNTLFRICSRLRNDGYTEQDCSALIQPHAERVGATPGHLEAKIRNVWERYQPKAISSEQHTGAMVLRSPANAEHIREYDERQQSVGTRGEFLSGYPKFDILTSGFRRGEILTVAARTGVGKTNWVIGPIRTFCEAGKTVLLFSTEMSFDQIWARYIPILDGTTEFQTHKFFICDDFKASPEKIEEALREVNPDLFIFDHINHAGTDYHVLSNFMMAIKELARRFDIPAIVTAQLNRSADWVEAGERVTPRLSMIKGSGAIEDISAQVLLLSEKRVHPDYTEIEGILDKNRHGEKGLIHFGLKKNPWRVCEL